MSVKRWGWWCVVCGGGGDGGGGGVRGVRHRRDKWFNGDNAPWMLRVFPEIKYKNFEISRYLYCSWKYSRSEAAAEWFKQFGGKTFFTMHQWDKWFNGDNVLWMLWVFPEIKYLRFEISILFLKIFSMPKQPLTDSNSFAARHYLT